MGLIFDILKEIPLSLIQREKVVDAEKVIESLRQELVDAQQNIVSLQHEKSLLANEVLDLKQAVYDLQIKNQPVCSSEHKILCLYKEYLSTTHDVISREIGLTVIETDYFINTLLDKGLISEAITRYPKSEKSYSLTQRGREYLIKV
jgi:predicted nuclease with TOPRIM domain